MRPIPLLALAACTPPVDGQDDDTSGVDTRVHDSPDDPDAGTAPTVRLLAPASGGAYATGADVAVAAVVGDAEDAPGQLIVAWTDEDGVTVDLDVSPAPDGTLVGALRLPPGPHGLSVQVTDTSGQSATAAVIFSVLVDTVDPRAPTVVIDAPADASLVDEGTTVALTATVGDDATAPEALVVTWADDVDGALGASTPDAAGHATLETATLSPGPHAVTATVRDGDGLTATASVHVVVDGRPSAPTISITPEAPGTDDDLVATVDTPAADPEGADVTLGWAWTRDGVATAEATSTVPSSATSRGERWRVTVTPDDGRLTGPSASAEVVVGNTPPTVDGATLGPDPVREGDTLDCAVGATADVDGDLVATSVAWEVDGVVVARDVDQLGSDAWARGDTVVCVVTPHDGFVAGPAVRSNAAVIADTAPTVADVVLTPAAPRAADTLGCAIVGWSDADGDGDASTFAWTVNGRAAGAGPTLSGAFVGGDVITCTATPWDGELAGAPRSTSTTVANTPPRLSGVTLSPEAATADDTLVCTPGAIADDDGTTSFTTTYAWAVDGRPVAATGSTLSGAFAVGDEVTCTVTPHDGTEAGAPVTSAPVRVGDRVPVVTSLTLSPTAPTSLDTLVASAEASDPDGDPVSLAWRWIISGDPVAATGPQIGRPREVFVRGDVVEVTVVPSDGARTGVAVSADVLVGNAPPSVRSLAITPSAPTRASVLTCAATFDDADGDLVAGTFRWTVGGVEVGTGATLSGRFVHGDEVVCTVTPDDGLDAGAPRSTAVSIGDTAPVVAFVDLTPATVTEATTLTCAPFATDVDGDTLTYAWRWFVSGRLVPLAQGPTLDGGSFDEGDTVRCGVVASDGELASAEVTSAAVVVGNASPRVTAVTITPSEADETSTLTCVPTLVDPDDVPLTPTFTWIRNGLALGVVGPTLDGASFAKGDQIRCRVVASDGTVDSVAVTSDAVRIGDAPPVVSSVSLGPVLASELTTLSCAPVVAGDPDGDAVTLSYAWTVDGVAAPVDASTLGGAWFDRGAEVRCTVTPEAAGLAGEPVTSAAVIVGNAAPTVTSIVITPTPAYTSSALTCTVAATDADGDPVAYAYAWVVDGAPLAVTADTLDAGSLARDQVVRCLVTPTDGTEAGDQAASAALVVANTAPVVTSVSLSPSSATEATTLACGATGVDDDGDAVTFSYAWSVDGNLVGPSLSTLSGAWFSRGQAVRCRATPFDVSTSGVGVWSSPVVIENSPPTIGSVSLSPYAPVTTSTLSLSASGVADRDGDAVTRTYSWFVNGVQVAWFGAGLSGSYFVRGDTVRVVVTVSDAYGPGGSATASVVVANSLPTAPTVAVTPVTPSPGVDDVVCSVVTPSTDLDADPIRYTFTWTRNGSAFAGAVDGGTTSTVAAAAAEAGDLLGCVVTPNDGTSNGVGAGASVRVAASTFTLGYPAPLPSPTVTTASSYYLTGQQLDVTDPATVLQLGMRLAATSTASARFALYTDAGGAPGTLVASTALNPLAGYPSGAQAVFDVLGGKVPLQPGTYWITWHFFGTVQVEAGTAAVPTAHRYLTSSSALPTSFGTPTLYTGNRANLFAVVMATP